MPPSSRVTCLPGTAARICQPTAPEPVNDTTGSRGSATRSGIAASATVRIDQLPGGRSVPASSSPRTSADSGVLGAGLSMIGAPTARAGATLWATRFSGKLKGEMPSTGPRGKRCTRASRPSEPGSVSSRCSSPDQRRASSAAQRKVDAARATSARAHMIGLPFSAVMSSASSSARARMPAETWVRAAARAWAGSAASGPAARVAPVTARSTCSGSACATVPTSRPSHGERTSKDMAACCGAPSTQNGRGSLMAPPLPALAAQRRDPSHGWPHWHRTQWRVDRWRHAATDTRTQGVGMLACGPGHGTRCRPGVSPPANDPGGNPCSRSCRTTWTVRAARPRSAGPARWLTRRSVRPTRRHRCAR